MNKLLTLLLLCGSFNAQSKHWSQVLSESDKLNFISELNLLTDDRLVFKARSEELTGVFSFDLQTKQLNQVFTADTNGSLNDMVQLGDKLYFLSRQNEQSFFRLWKTDGSMQGTQQVSEMNFNTINHQKALAVYNDTLFGVSNDGKILELVGAQLVTHDIQSNSPLLSNMCVFGPQNFIIADLSTATQVFRINGSSTTELSSLFPQNFIIKNLEGIGTDCYINFSEGNQNSSLMGVLKVSQSGETQLFRESEFGLNVWQVFNHNNQRFAHVNENNASTLVKLDENDSVIESIMPLGVGSFTEYASTPSLLYLNFRNQTILRDEIYTVDNNLLVNNIQTGTNLMLPQFKPSLDSNTSTEQPLDRSFAENFEITLLNHNGLETKFKSTGFDHLDTVTAKNTNDKYFFLRNRESGLKSIFALNDEPKIGVSLNGIWHDPELENQGLFIKQGDRNDGSKYISTTMYTYRGGEPFWLAGNANFSPNQETLEINLFDFQGTGFLELEEAPIRSGFGSIQIRPVACDQLQATVLHDNQAFNFNLIRIDNTTYKKYCLEQVNPQ